MATLISDFESDSPRTRKRRRLNQGLGGDSTSLSDVQPSLSLLAPGPVSESVLVHQLSLDGSKSRSTRAEPRHHPLAPAPVSETYSTNQVSPNGKCTQFTVARPRLRQLAPAPTPKTTAVEHESRPLPLIADYERRQNATYAFPEPLSDSTLRLSVSRFEDALIRGAKTVEVVCASCGCFVKGLGHVVALQNPLLELFRCSETQKLLLDSCALKLNEGYQFCAKCYSSVCSSRSPKFSALNNVNVTFCQDVPLIMSNLTHAEECIVARCHPIGSIVKLCPNGKFNSTAYTRIRGHIIVLPQEPGPLLQLLPSPDLNLHEKIQVIWFGTQTPKVEDLRPYLEVRKSVVLEVLLWLCKYNVLYKHITINHRILRSWPENFIPSALQELIVHVEDDSTDEREGYAMNLQAENFDNEMQASLGSESQSDPISSGCVYSDIECIRSHPDLRFISALMVMKHREAGNDNRTSTNSVTEAPKGPEDAFRDGVPIIRYIAGEKTRLLSSWQDYDYFTGAFPTLFPFGRGGHLSHDPERKVKVSISEWFKWCLTHHSRRHHTFLYLAYDVSQLRAAVLGHTVMVNRKDWKVLSRDMGLVTYERLLAAAQSIQSTGQFSDPVVLSLLKRMDCVANQVPQSHARMQTMRLHMRALFVSEGMPAFWMTLNPNDLRSPLVLTLAGLDVSSNCQTLAAPIQSDLRSTTKQISMNPVAVAQFFDLVVRGVLEALLNTGDSSDVGILGNVSNYFGVVETNGRGMLHLHILVWLAGNLEFLSLREKLQTDSAYAARMTSYLDGVISCSLKETNENIHSTNEGQLPPSSKNRDQSDTDFRAAILDDGTYVASKSQIHSALHTPTCFKYSRNKQSQKCRFLFPRPLVGSTHVNEHGIIQIKRNNQWIAPFNPIIASELRSNHDINFVPTVTRALAAVYYMTNYATKHDISQYQQVVAAAIVQKNIEEARSTNNPKQRDKNLIAMPNEKLGMAAFNRLASEREVSGPQAAACLIGLPDCYTRPTILRYLNLNTLRLNFWSVITKNHEKLKSQAEKTRMTHSAKPPASMLENYYYRSPQFDGWSFYEYVKLISIKPYTQKLLPGDSRFAEGHSCWDDMAQHYDSNMSASKYTVVFTGKLTEGQNEEDKLKGGHITTMAISNDVALVSLMLLVPWTNLGQNFDTAEGEDSCKSKCVDIWTEISTTLPLHLQRVGQNFALLRKSYDDARLDAMLLRDAEKASVSFANKEPDCTNDEGMLQDLDEGAEDLYEAFSYNPFDLNNLSEAFNRIRAEWKIQDSEDSRGVIALEHAHRVSSRPHTPQNQDFSDNEDTNYQRLPETEAENVQNIDHSTLKAWEQQFEQVSNLDRVAQALDKDFDNPGLSCSSDESEEEVIPKDVLNQTSVEALKPVINRLKAVVPDIGQRKLRVGPCPTGSSIALLIKEGFPLNQKQELIVKKVIDQAILKKDLRQLQNKDQLLLYVGGEGGVGKSRVIKAIEIGYELLDRSQEVMLTASTGAAADAIDGHTIHSAISLGHSGNGNTKISSRCQFLWRQKTVLIVDEVSMISLALLGKINDRCNRIMGMERESSSNFGGLTTVIFLGDFHQFSPIGGLSLWQNPSKTDGPGQFAKHLWHQFENVVILDEQMRQQTDCEFLSLVRRARSASLTEDDVRTLNMRVIKNYYTMSTSNELVAVTRQNVRRQNINRVRMEQFAKDRKQHIYAFPASHTRTTLLGHKSLPLETLLKFQDGEMQAKGPGIFLYTRNMPAMILENICTPWGLVNGAKGEVTGVKVNDKAQFRHLDSLYILCSHPPICVLFKRAVMKHIPFTNIADNSIPVFAKTRPITIPPGKDSQQKMVVRRVQVPVTPAFALTEYKVQGATFDMAILDLRRKDYKRASATEAHKSYCSTYVQLSRLRTLSGLFLLQQVRLSDLDKKPDSLLCTEDYRLAELQRATLSNACSSS